MVDWILPCSCFLCPLEVHFNHKFELNSFDSGDGQTCMLRRVHTYGPKAATIINIIQLR